MKSPLLAPVDPPVVMIMTFAPLLENSDELFSPDKKHIPAAVVFIDPEILSPAGKKAYNTLGFIHFKIFSHGAEGLLVGERLFADGGGDQYYLRGYRKDAYFPYSAPEYYCG